MGNVTSKKKKMIGKTKNGWKALLTFQPLIYKCIEKLFAPQFQQFRSNGWTYNPHQAIVFATSR
jgi:hypothetical protein